MRVSKRELLRARKAIEKGQGERGYSLQAVAEVLGTTPLNLYYRLWRRKIPLIREPYERRLGGRGCNLRVSTASLRLLLDVVGVRADTARQKIDSIKSAS